MVLDESKKIVIFGRVHTTLEELENTALFLLFGLLSTLISQENGVFWKTLFNKLVVFENAVFSFLCGWKPF